MSRTCSPFSIVLINTLENGLDVRIYLVQINIFFLILRNQVSLSTSTSLLRRKARENKPYYYKTQYDDQSDKVGTKGRKKRKQSR